MLCVFGGGSRSGVGVLSSGGKIPVHRFLVFLCSLLFVPCILSLDPCILGTCVFAGPLYFKSLHPCILCTFGKVGVAFQSMCT